MVVCFVAVTGSAHAISAGGSPPVNTAPPAISGLPETGQTLSCSDGSWANFPTSFTYAWNRGGVAIAGATASTYAVAAADVGTQLTCTVTATNGDGSQPATSAGVTATAAPQPVSPSLPAPPPAAPAPPALPKASDLFDWPSAKRCASRRKFRIRVRKVAGVTFESVAVYVNGRRTKTVRGARVSAPVDLRGLPAGRFAAKIVVKTSDGRSISHARKYRTCSAKRGAKRRHKL